MGSALLAAVLVGGYEYSPRYVVFWNIDRDGLSETVRYQIYSLYDNEK